MKKHGFSCKDIDLKIMALIDGELSHNEVDQIKEHLVLCKHCQEKYNSMKKMKERLSHMKFKKLPEMYWDEYWQHVYNRIERGISWIFISIGVIIILIYSLWNLINKIIPNIKFDYLLLVY